jgi:hypothetical protein
MPRAATSNLRAYCSHAKLPEMGVHQSVRDKYQNVLSTGTPRIRAIAVSRRRLQSIQPIDNNAFNNAAQKCNFISTPQTVNLFSDTTVHQSASQFQTTIFRCPTWTQQDWTQSPSHAPANPTFVAAGSNPQPTQGIPHIGSECTLCALFGES